MDIYQGPDPKDIDARFPNHSSEYIVCLINGEQKKKITSSYLKKLGWTKELYLTKFPNAPLTALNTRYRYKKYAESNEGRQIRSRNLTELNNDSTFQSARIDGMYRFMNSSEWDKERKRRQENAKKQHLNGQSAHIKKVYWESKYPGSEEQRRRSTHMRRKNPMFRDEVRNTVKTKNRENAKKGTLFKQEKYGDTHLYYQSSYEKLFLDHIFKKGITIDNIDNGPVFTENGRELFYVSDFLLFNKYVVEIKSWYIERLQEQNKPGITQKKKEVVIDAGYEWLYVKDEDYKEVDIILGKV